MSHPITCKILRAATLALAAACALVAVFTFANRLYLDDPLPVHAQAPILVPWTAVGATGAVDEGSLSRFAFTNASAGYLSTTASVDLLEFRFNVTNTFDNNASPAAPGWTTLELGAQAPATSVVAATLYKVNPCTGAQAVVCSTRVTNSSAGTCKACTFAAGTINFATTLYYVRVTVDRNTPSELPLLHTLRIF